MESWHNLVDKIGLALFIPRQLALIGPSVDEPQYRLIDRTLSVVICRTHIKIIMQASYRVQILCANALSHSLGNSDFRGSRHGLGVIN